MGNDIDEFLIYSDKHEFEIPKSFLYFFKELKKEVISDMMRFKIITHDSVVIIGQLEFLAEVTVTKSCH